ncbi:Heterokaryon incompatibility [Akanthomyces lecanii RCEF 1005]|uniref:Heterokaryon incompatibility n=1 Tax=Akanthomyces lecanii RCEF 1005 TaxID=1081108 RepID=A0A162LK36_CORDF|nr:Heterokaryon incompatibility [Akanthomyces lecanii RCEF 1005]
METQTQEPGIAYRYGALKYAKSIRLLYLHTGDSYHQLPIEVSLREFPIDALPSFGALSYTWATEDGLASLSQELLCGGASIKITKNCEAALKRLRRPREDQVLWVDAVCIDQSNVEERSLQIGLMRQIYSQASWVALWLGEPSLAVDEESGLPLSDLGMDYIHDFAVEIAERTNSGQDLGEGPLYQEFIKDRMAFQYSNSEVFTPRVRGLWDVLHRSWWKRLWVVQEVALSRQPTLICGSKGEPFHNVKVVIEALIRPQQAVEVMEYNSLFIASTFHQFHVRHMIETGGMSKISPPGVKALRILDATRNTQASDARDKIYGVLGFFGASETDPENIFPEPDYKKTAVELYADVSRAIITNTGNLDVLSSCYGFFQSSVPDLPSWAACWNDTPVQYFDEKVFSAAGSSSVVYEDSDDKLLLRIKGRKVDFAKLTGQLPSSIGYSNEACIELWRYWWKFASALESYPTGETVADVFKATLCWGSDLAFHRQKPGGYTETFDAWLKVLTGPDDTSTAARHVFNDKEPSKYAHRATAITWGRNLGITDGGYLAMVPITSEVSDEIVIFQGAKLPFIVRTEDGKSKLVGPCYVHGMMDGEFATKDDAPAAGELAWFALC